MVDIARLFEHVHRLPTAELQRLDRDDVETLRRTALEGEPANRVRALEMYTAAVRDAALDDLANVAGADREPVEIRAAAAAQLGRLTTREAEPVAIRLLTAERESVVRTRLAGALGKIAGVGAIPALERTADADSMEHTRRQARYAIDLIAHRNHLRERALRPNVKTVAIRAQRTVPIRVESARTAANVIDWIRGDEYGLHLSIERAMALRCGPNLLHVLTDEREAASGVRRVTEVPMLFALVTTRSQEYGSHSVSRTVMAGPTDEGHFYVAIHRTDGRLVHFGGGRIMSGGRVEFEIRSVETPGNVLVELAGFIQNGSPVFTRSVTATHTMGPNEPKPFTPPFAGKR